MYSPARTFWDMNLGGMGGDFSNIIHRFIPDFKCGTINPLMNINVTTSNDIDTHTIISDIKMYTGLSERKQMVQDSIELQLH